MMKLLKVQREEHSMAKIKNFFGTDINMETIKKPSDLYRMMRPEYFSDSHIEKERIDREQFKFILANLSTDMRQDAFEELTRRCVIKLITPNIIPQTGPTGGGDAKADLITYPVTEEVSSIWTLPDGGSSAQDQWAFAISTKKAWSQKMDCDVKKIMERYPGCKRIYFCTNQAVSARNKEQKQQKYEIETYILDLNWYLQAIYDQGCYNDAIEALGLRDSLKEIKVLGPNDTRREERLREIEDSLPKILRDGVEDRYVADLIEAALLARELERPKQEVEGRFSVALEAAKKYGFSQQVYECVYQKAWTDFYWYDDPDSSLEGYLCLKSMLQEDVNVVRIEKLYNLYRLLVTSSGQGMMTKDFNHQGEQRYMETLCSRLEDNPAKPSCALFLKICLLEDKLIESLQEKADLTDISDVLHQLKEAIQNASHHLSINFESQAEVLVNIGGLIGESREFDELIDVVSKIQSDRSSDISAANIQYERGVQLLGAQRFENAVKHLSKSYVLYHKENTITELVRTSGFLGKAYSEMDLLYSAKTYYIRALSILINDVGNNGRSDHLIVTILIELCLLEIRLGQIASVLEWLAMLDAIVSTVQEYLNDDFLRERSRIDALLGARIYETVLDKDTYGVLPDIFERYQLNFSKNVLLVKIGAKEDVDEDYRFLLESDDSTRKYILQMAGGQKALFPLVLNGNKSAVLKTLVHGCTIRTVFEGATYGQTYSEMFLSFMEMLMESKKVRMFPSTPEITFEIKCNLNGDTKIERGANSSTYLVTINKNTFQNQNNIWETLIQMMSSVVSGSVMVNDFEGFLEIRQEDDSFMTRLSLLSGYATDISNIVPNFRYVFIEQFVQTGDHPYEIKIEKTKDSIKRANKQSDAIVTSLIDVKLWDEAKWKGCGYLLSRDYSEPGIMVLMYGNIAAGIKIFEQWEKDYNEGKLNLRIVIITGVDRKHPQWYKVLLTPDVKQILNNESKPQERYVISSSRFHLMNAVSDDNIKYLRLLYGKFRFIGLSASAMINNQMSFDTDKRYNKVIPIRNVDFVEAWTIKENDVESVAILADDDVVIPFGHEKDAPILEVIAKKKNYGKEV